MDNESRLVFAFDVGKASLGVCARRGHNILDLKSLLVPAEYASTEDLRVRRRAYRTRLSHYKREEWLIQLWRDAGLSPLSSSDSRLQREFPRKADTTLYNSASLRIALLQNKPLGEWQIFKALWSAIQHRGYDPECNWDRPSEDASEISDSKENKDFALKYTQELNEAIQSRQEYAYPCYLEAYLIGLWHPSNPENLSPRITHQTLKVRTKGRVAPRYLVENEIRNLFDNAKKQLTALSAIDTNEFLYGPGKVKYASLHAAFAKYRGTEWDAQGVLSQKVPRFDNRIISKCVLMPKRNVCKAGDELNITFKLLQKLKNYRFVDEYGEQKALSPEELKSIYQDIWPALEKQITEKKPLKVNKTDLKKAIEKHFGKYLHTNMPVEAFPIQSGGRSRFCRPALRLMNHILLAGTAPINLSLTDWVEADDAKQGITRDEVVSAISRLGESWEGFHVGDARYIDADIAQGENNASAIVKLIGSVNNPVVRHRLTLFWNELKTLVKQHGKPERVILEFVRGDGGLESNKKSSDWEKAIKRNEKENDILRDKLVEHGIPVTQKNLLRLKLHQEQDGHCPYSGEKLCLEMLSSYDVDHIVPVTNEVPTDAYYNKVLCVHDANREKGNKTPHEWLGASDAWPTFLQRITRKDSRYSVRKQQLLTSSEARELVESYNGLAETAYIARLAQQIVAFQMGWGLQTKDDNRRVFVNDGKTTAKIRRIYKLNDLLLSQEEKQSLTEADKGEARRKVWKKNRSNPKHHALDAYCISYSQDLRIKSIDDDGFIHWHIPGLENSLAQFERKLIDLFPQSLRRNTKELYPLETIYGYRTRQEDNKVNHYLVVKKNLYQLLATDRKAIKDILDLDIRKDLAELSQSIDDNKEWQELLQAYIHPIRQTRVIRVSIIASRSSQEPTVGHDSRMVLGEYKDYGSTKQSSRPKGQTTGQFKHTKANKGQIIYQGKNGRWLVQQVLAHENTSVVIQKLTDSGFALYQSGKMFYPGCSIFVPKPFTAGSVQLPAGLYKSRTIKATGEVKIENANGQEYMTNIKYLIEANFSLVSYRNSFIETVTATY
jgi:CRISPR-associated endonuclease Csn1